MLRTVDSVLSIDAILEICFHRGRGAGRERPRRPPCVGEVHTIYPLSEMRGALFDTIGGIFWRRVGLQTQPLGLERLASKWRIALDNIDQPIGVSTYRVTRELPAPIREELPTVEDLQEVVNKLRSEIETLRSESPNEE
jgi:hypothetical protein